MKNRLLLGFTLLLIIVPSLHGKPMLSQQQRPGEVRGHVADSTGAVIADAKVFVREMAEDNFRLAIHTDKSGGFLLSLPEGSYDVLVSSPGFQTALQILPVFMGKARSTEWKLKLLPCGFPGPNCDSFPKK